MKPNVNRHRTGDANLHALPRHDRRMTALAIYDMDKTVTRRPTYGPFLVHAMVRLSPWRVLLVPILLVTGAAYGLRLVDRARLKELNYRLLIGGVSPSGSSR